VKLSKKNYREIMQSKIDEALIERVSKATTFKEVLQIFKETPVDQDVINAIIEEQEMILSSSQLDIKNR